MSRIRPLKTDQPTPEMIFEGAKELMGFDPEGETFAEAAERVYRAMARARPYRFSTNPLEQ